MNQAVKSAVYGKGTQRQLCFLADTGGMNDEERRLLQMIHDGKGDLDIQETLGLDRKARERVEESVRAKLTIAIFHCIDFTMWEEN